MSLPEVEKGIVPPDFVNLVSVRFDGNQENAIVLFKGQNDELLDAIDAPITLEEAERASEVLSAAALIMNRMTLALRRRARQLAST